MSAGAPGSTCSGEIPFTPVVCLLCARYSGVTGQLNTLSVHKNCCCVGKYSLGTTSCQGDHEIVFPHQTVQLFFQKDRSKPTQTFRLYCRFILSEPSDE